jgi:hypothetical protein
MRYKITNRRWSSAEDEKGLSVEMPKLYVLYASP